MKRFVYVIISLICCALQSLRRLLGGRPGLVVLYYHGITGQQAPGFARQMDMLKRGAKPVAASFTGPLDRRTCCAAVTFDDGFASFLHNALPALAEGGIHSTMFVPSGALGQQPQWLHDSSHPDKDDRVMTAEELRSLPRDLVEIGSHTVDHVPLTSLPIEQARAQLVDSKRQLEEALGRNVALFSFPHGACNAELLDAARAAGYTRLFGIEPYNNPLDSNDLLIGRVVVSPDDWPVEFWLKLRGAYSWLAIAQRIKRRLKGPR